MQRSKNLSRRRLDLIELETNLTRSISALGQLGLPIILLSTSTSNYTRKKEVICIGVGKWIHVRGNGMHDASHLLGAEKCSNYKVESADYM